MKNGSQQILFSLLSDASCIFDYTVTMVTENGCQTCLKYENVLRPNLKDNFSVPKG